MSWEWSFRHTEGIIVLHILPLDSKPITLPDGSSHGRAQAWGWLIMCIFLCPTWPYTAWWKWIAEKTHYVPGSGRSMHPSPALLTRRSGLQGAIRAQMNPAVRKFSIGTSKPTKTVGILMQTKIILHLKKGFIAIS